MSASKLMTISESDIYLAFKEQGDSDIVHIYDYEKGLFIKKMY